MEFDPHCSGEFWFSELFNLSTILYYGRSENGDPRKLRPENEDPKIKRRLANQTKTPSGSLRHALWLHRKKPVLKKVDNLSVRNVIIY